MMGGAALESEALAPSLAGLAASLDTLEAHFLGQPGGPFIGGRPDVSVADLVAVTELEQPLAAGFQALLPFLLGARSRVSLQA